MQKLIKENETQKKKLNEELNREKHQQQVELLKQQNKISEDKLVYLKDMERKLKQIVFDWKRMNGEEDKRELIKNLQALLFNQKEKQVKEKVKKKIDSNYITLAKKPVIGDFVLMKQNNKIAQLTEIRGKKAVVALGAMPLQVNYDDLVAVRKKLVEDDPKTIVK